jgi:hypothetical protein
VQVRGVGAVSSAQAFGVFTIKALTTRVVLGLGSAQSFGLVLGYRVWLRPAPPGSLNLGGIVCVDVVLAAAVPASLTLAAQPVASLALAGATTSSIDLDPAECG